MSEPMTEAELRDWAEKVKEHSAAARGVLALLDRLENQRREVIVGIENGVVYYTNGTKFKGTEIVWTRTLDAPAEQTNAVYKPFDGSTGTPADGKAGRKSESEQ